MHILSMAPPKTCWWIQGKGTETIARCDHLVGLNRYYFRKWRCYVYILHIGRLRIMFGVRKKGTK